MLTDTQIQEMLNGFDRTITWAELRDIADYMAKGGKFPRENRTVRFMCWESEIALSDPDCDDRPY